MSLTESTCCELHSEYLQVTDLAGREISKLTYVEHHGLRRAVMALIDVLMSEYQNDIFSSICCRCGRC